jgi:predicted RNA-binding protein with PUA-like domain
MPPKRNYWLMKSEPSVYSVDDLKKDGSTYWDGVRNFQARNYMQEMKVGDAVFFYHSDADPKAIVGLARVCQDAYPDHTQYDKKSKYYERRATKDKPYWYMVDIEFVSKFKEPLALQALREMPELEEMSLLKKGQRLSVQPVAPDEWKTILKKAGTKFTPKP